jgi:endonuclease/exonuclease/phosphatase family metal-dependent hydrolase
MSPAGRGGSTSKPIAFWSRIPTSCGLQEVTSKSLIGWKGRLEREGYEVETSVPTVDSPPGRRLGVLIASRHAFTLVKKPMGVPWPERLLVADVRLPDFSQALRVVCLHAPLSQDPDQVKIRTFEAVHANLAALSPSMPAILCGDLNTPQHEAADGIVQTFGQTRKGKMHARMGQRQDDAERAILTGLPGWHDAFRELYGYEVSGRSWKASRGSNPGYRLDHIFLSPNLRATACEYDHMVRENRLSDHSAMYATVDCVAA